jgi:hypothetical protein
MDITTRSARITDPIPFLAEPGRPQSIPVGPCLIEAVDGRSSVDIIWGARGQNCATLPIEEVQAAQSHGYLVLLD